MPEKNLAQSLSPPPAPPSGADLLKGALPVAPGPGTVSPPGLRRSAAGVRPGDLWLAATVPPHHLRGEGPAHNSPEDPPPRIRRRSNMRRLSVQTAQNRTGPMGWRGQDQAPLAPIKTQHHLAPQLSPPPPR